MDPAKRYPGSYRGHLRFFLPILLTLAFLFVPACGKKGALSLTSYEKPAAPSLLGVSQREEGMVLSWSYPIDKERAISGFIVLRSSDSGFEKIALLETEVRTFADTDVRKGVSYVYKVVSRNQRGVLSADSNLVSVIVVTPPVPPESISWNISGDSLLLSWVVTEKGTMYNVYKAVEKGAYSMVPVNKSPLSDNFFRDEFSPVRTVYYTLRSLTKNEVVAEGPASREIVVNPHDLIPPAPQEVHYFAAPDKIYLYWKEPDTSWITGFRVYRKFGAGDYSLIAETQIPSFLDIDAPSKKRDYRITAVGPAKEGPAAEISGVLFVPE
jgi:hypothetical protein